MFCYLQTQCEFIVHQPFEDDVASDDGLQIVHTTHIPERYIKIKKMRVKVNLTLVLSPIALLGLQFYNFHFRTDQCIYDQNQQIKMDLNFDFQSLFHPKITRIEVKVSFFLVCLNHLTLLFLPAHAVLYHWTEAVVNENGFEVIRPFIRSCIS